jgi:hypothetical protein
MFRFIDDLLRKIFPTNGSTAQMGVAHPLPRLAITEYRPIILVSRAVASGQIGRRLQAARLLLLIFSQSQARNLHRMIPEIDIWRAANLMLKRYGDAALEESASRADELAAQDDHNGAAVWLRITDAVGQLANDTPSGPLH